MTREELQQRIASHGWFHRINLNGLVTPGPDDSPAKLQRVRLPDSLAGKTVLDIGAWDGFFSFESERRGARRVLAVDSYCWTGDGWGNKTGFDLAREVLGSRVEDREMEVLELAPEKIGLFDVVLFLGVLYHMRYPLQALEKVAAVTGEMLILETKVDLLNVRAPAMAFYQGPEMNNDPTNYWAPNVSGLCSMLRSVGFRRIEIVSPPRSWLIRGWQALTGGPAGRREFGRGRVVVHAWK